MDRTRLNLILICFSQFGVASSVNFVNVFLPFFALEISPYSFQETLLWIGAIMGIAPLCAAVTATLWGSLSHRFNPKSILLANLIANSISFVLMSFITNLHLFLILRFCQGLVGGASTIGMIIVSSSSSKENLPSHMGLFQSAITFGQLVGPPLGSFAAVSLGFRGAFLGASVVLFLSFGLCSLYLTDIPRLPKRETTVVRVMLDRRIIAGWVLCCVTMIQLTFLPSVLPNVFEKFNIEQSAALKLAGVVVMLYTATSMIGTYVWSSLSTRFGLYRMIMFTSGLGILLQALLVFNRGIIDFTIIRMIQTGLVAATFPLLLSVFANESDGRTIGFLNSSRFAGNAAGPFLATSILAYSDLTSLYLCISLVSLFALLGFRVYLKQKG
jgi:MFS family permease